MDGTRTNIAWTRRHLFCFLSPFWFLYYDICFVSRITGGANRHTSRVLFLFIYNPLSLLKCSCFVDISTRACGASRFCSMPLECFYWRFPFINAALFYLAYTFFLLALLLATSWLLAARLTSASGSRPSGRVINRELYVPATQRPLSFRRTNCTTLYCRLRL